MSANTYHPQTAKFLAMVAQNMPPLSADVMQGWIQNPKALRKFLDGLTPESAIDGIEHVVDLDADPFVPEGLTVEEHHKGGQFAWDAAKVELYLSNGQSGRKYIVGTKLREEMKGKNPFNANLLDYLLKNPNIIPDEWKGKYVFFWGTTYRGRDGGLFVRCLCWFGGRWFWSCHWLARAFFGVSPAALRAS